MKKKEDLLDGRASENNEMAMEQMRILEQSQSECKLACG